MYEAGQGTLPNQQEAFKLYQAAANNGHANSQYRLGLMYAKGKGAPKDIQQAANWYRKSAQQGHSQAKYHLDILKKDQNNK